MKFVYFAPHINCNGNHIYSGVAKKVIAQTSELSKITADVQLVSMKDPIILNKKKAMDNSIFNRIEMQHKMTIMLINLVKSLTNESIIYLRYPFPLFFYFYILINNKKMCKVITEHNTIELSEYKLYKNPVLYFSELVFGKLSRKYVDAFICVTNEIAEYEISMADDPNKPHITIGNGINVSSIGLRNPPIFSDTLNLIFVATIWCWHGIDRLLRGLAIYDGITKIVLHVAGGGEELPHLQRLADDLDISDRIVFHGFITGKDLDVLFDQCHIAVGNIGIHRKGLTQTSELKGREYCARGIPYIIACADPDFPPDFPYILRLPANESPIDIKQVLAFAEEMCANPHHPEKMRRYAEEHLDWSMKMRKLKGFLEILVGYGEEDRALESSAYHFVNK